MGDFQVYDTEGKELRQYDIVREVNTGVEAEVVMATDGDGLMGLAVVNSGKDLCRWLGAYGNGELTVVGNKKG